MNEEDTLRAARDQTMAFYRDHAEACKAIHDQYIRAGFSPDHSMEFVFYQLRRIEGCDCDD